MICCHSYLFAVANCSRVEKEVTREPCVLLDCALLGGYVENILAV